MSRVSAHFFVMEEVFGKQRKSMRWMAGRSHTSLHPIKKTAFMAELADRGVVRLAFRRFVVARAAILPSRLFLLVELPFPGVLTPHFIQLKKTAIKAVFFNWWELRGSNSRPSRCKRDALPAELNSHRVYERVYTLLKIINQAKNCTIFIFLLKLFYIK